MKKHENTERDRKEIASGTSSAKIKTKILNKRREPRPSRKENMQRNHKSQGQHLMINNLAEKGKIAMHRHIMLHI